MTFYIDQNGHRINPYAAITYEGTTYNGNVLQFPAVVAAMGITEQAEPEPPAEYVEHPDWYYRTEQDVAPWVVYTKKQTEAIVELEKQKVIAQIRAIEDAVDNDMRKVTRLFMIECLEFLAAQQGITKEVLLEKNKTYRTFITLEAQIQPLREQI